MNYSDIKKFDIANGPGVRLSVFVSGCRHHCPHCFNPETWDFCYGRPWTQAEEASALQELSKSYYSGLSLLGGDPLEPENWPVLLPFLKRVRSEYPDKSIWCYTGCLLEELLAASEPTEDGEKTAQPRLAEFLAQLDVLIDGPFVQALKKPGLKFRGSSNQRIIDMKASLISGRAVLWEERPYIEISYRENPSGGVSEA